MLSPAHLAPHPYAINSSPYTSAHRPQDYYLALPLPPIPPTTAPLAIRRQRSTPNLVANLAPKAHTAAPLLSPLLRAPSSASSSSSNSSTATTATSSSYSHPSASSSSLKPPSTTGFSCLSLGPFADPHHLAPTGGEGKRRPNKLRKARSAMVLKASAAVELTSLPAVAPSAAERMRAERRRREERPVCMGLGGLVEARPWGEEVETRLGEVAKKRFSTVAYWK